MARGLAVVVILALGIPLSAQVEFRSGVDLVTLNVVVTDSQQKLAPGLTAADFTVYEDGVPQDLAYFASTTVPIDLALLLDTSSSMTGRMTTMQEAAVGFASNLRPGDRISVIDIKEGMRILHPLDTDISGAQEAIKQTTAGGNTALFNGLYMTLREMRKQATADVRRPAIVVFSDGDDTSSLVSFDDVLEAAKRSGIAVYTITLRYRFASEEDEAPSRGRSISNGEFQMRTLAQETGARSFFPTDIRQLAGVYSEIAQELGSEYSLGYASKNLRRDGAFRKVNVRITQPNLRARTRAGYFAPSDATYPPR